MTLISKLEAAAGKVLSEVEAGVKDVDGVALHDAKELLADAKTAETQALTLAAQYKAEIEALARQVTPEVAAELETLAAKVLADFTGLFGA